MAPKAARPCRSRRALAAPRSRERERPIKRGAPADLDEAHEAELAKLVAHVERAIARYRVGELDVHDVDEVIHRYSKAARELWKFCWSTGSGSHVLFVARTLELRAAEAEQVDWWEEAERRRRR